MPAEEILTRTCFGGYNNICDKCPGGGTGRRVRLRGVWATVPVQVRSWAPIFKIKRDAVTISFFICDMPGVGVVLVNGGGYSSLLLDPSGCIIILPRSRMVIDLI
jgi:hypothetical protein